MKKKKKNYILLCTPKLKFHAQISFALRAIGFSFQSISHLFCFHLCFNLCFHLCFNLCFHLCFNHAQISRRRFHLCFNRFQPTTTSLSSASVVSLFVVIVSARRLSIVDSRLCSSSLYCRLSSLSLPVVISFAMNCC